MAVLYRLIFLFIALVTVKLSLALPGDGPVKPVPSKSHVGRSSDSPRLISREPIEPLKAKLFLKSNKPVGPDPIRFVMRASKDSVALGEEFEITITAELLDISPQSMFFFEEQKSFALKVLIPEGFVQTGGDYHDYIGGEFQQGGLTSATYQLRGRLTQEFTQTDFTLLRGPRNASSASLFEKKQTLKIRTSNFLTDNAPRARQVVTSTTGCQLKNQAAIIRKGPTTGGVTSLTILVQNALPTYQYSADSIFFSLSNVVRVTKSSGFLFVRDGKQTTCFQKFPYTITTPTNLPLAAPSVGVVPSDCDFIPDFVNLTASAGTLCNQAEYVLPVNSRARAANSSSSVFLSVTNCSTNIVWYKDGAIYPGTGRQITVTSPGTYKASCGTNRCPYGSFDSQPITITDDCPPSIWSLKSTVCGNEQTSLVVAGCTGGGVRFRNNEGYEVCMPASENGITVKPWIAAGTYSARCITSLVSNNQCEDTSPTTDWTEWITIGTYCPPASCDFNIANQTINLNCNTSATLSINCTGADCNNVNASWSGPNNWSSSELSVASPLQTANGTADYILTLSKDGCSNKTSTVHLVTSGCTVANPCDSQLPPNAPTSVHQDAQCPGNEFDLWASGCSTGYRWYDANDGGNILSKTSNYKPSPDKTTTYYVRCVDDCNKESTSVQVTATVNDCPTFCSGATPEYIYSLDQSGCTAFSGWALDKKCSKSLTLKIFLDGIYLQNLNANNERSDVPPARGLSDDFKYCGFSWTPEFTGEHLVSIRLSDGTEIAHLSLTCNVTDPCLGQSTAARWVDEDVPYCSNGIQYQAQRDKNPCSATYNQIQAVPTGANTGCQSCSGIPTPSVSSVLSTANGNTTWTLTATGCDAGQTIRWYRDDDNNNYTPDRNSLSFINFPDKFGIYAKCILGDCAGPASVTLTYPANPCDNNTPNAPTLVARVAGTSSAQSLTLTASGCPVGSQINWEGPNGTTSTGSTWEITSFNQTAIYYARCKNSSNCPSEATPITVNYVTPSAPIIRTTSTLLCAGQTATLTATNCQAGTTVRWSTGQTGSPLVITPTESASYKAYCVYGEVVSDASNKIDITISNSLTINGRRDYSLGETISLTASSSVPGPITYTWSGPAGFTQTGQTLQIIGAAVSQTGNYTVVATASQGCAGQATVAISVTASTFACTCQDCDTDAVKLTTNPANPIVNARNRGNAGKNYVSESVYLDETGGSVSQTISYFDGLGRPSQKVSVGTAGGPGAGDVIAPTVYDAFGREPQKYLPYVDATSGAFRPAGAGAVPGYYAGLPGKTGNAFATTTFEASPLNRVLTQTAPGSTTPQRMNYRTNTASEVPLLTYDFATAKISVGSYAASQLYVTESTDENQNKTIEYKDKEGRVVAKSVSGRVTLYGYDDFGYLRCVVPPLASAGLSGSFDAFDTANDLLFAYDYDQRGRMSRKKVPGAGITRMTYDTRDRLETSTDAKNTTITTVYDDLDRVIATKQGSNILTQTFYDTYSQADKGFDGAHAYGQTRFSGNPKGLVTGTWTAVLATTTASPLVSNTYYDNLGRPIQTISDNAKGSLDISSTKLDFVGRVLESKLTTTNPAGGGTGSPTTITIDSRTAYEQGGRVKSVCQQVSDNQQSPLGSVGAYWEPVARHTYNGIGELTSKTLGCGIQTIDYAYTMRGWLSQMNDPADLNKGFAAADKRFFGMSLGYDKVGNIDQWTYRNAQTNYGPPYDLTQKPAYQYAFTYDNLNRIKTGNLTQQGQTVFALDNLNYDDNGNITTLNRTMGAATDRLTYAYKANSNQLASVSDGGSVDFARSSSYGYDAVGNLVSDAGKSITGIAYNYLNLPSQVSRSSGGEVSYVYSASGQKLSASFPAAGNTPAKAYDYVGGLVYENNQLEFIPTAEGRVLPPGRARTTVRLGTRDTIVGTNNFYRYEYQLKDHLGNLRVACRCGEKPNATLPSDTYAPLVVQEQHYDPFGLDLTSLNSQMGVTASRFKFNGKEDESNLGWIDFNWRHYDPTIGRFISTDRLAEKFPYLTTYQYASNRPVDGIDLDGLEYMRSPGIANPNGFQNIHITLKVRPDIDTKLLSTRETASYLKAAQQLFSSSVGAIQDKDNKTTYSGSLVFDPNATISLGINDPAPGENMISGLSIPGSAGVKTAKYREGKFNLKSRQSFAVDVVHELLHQGGVEHPIDELNSASDVRLQPVNGEVNSYETTSSTLKPDIYYNIMLYGFYKVDGKTVDNVRGSKERGTKISLDQLRLILQNIDKGKVNGEAMNH